MTDHRPNILLITTDQQRWDTCGPDKQRILRTPHLDMLAADGMTFNRAYADCPICVPSRVALMTGQTCFRHQMGLNQRTCRYFDEDGTLPTVLRAAGYQTAAFGKAHFDPQYKSHGFECFEPLDEYYRWIARHYGPEVQPRRHGLGENEPYPVKASCPENLTVTSWITERATDWLSYRRDPTKPWFCWVSYSKPHAPLDPPEPYYSMYQQHTIPEPRRSDWSERDDAPEAVRMKRHGHGVIDMHPEHIRAMRAAYYGCISQIDHGIGRIMGAVQDTGPHELYSFKDNTLIIFASDHGDMMGDHGMLSKGEMYEGSARIPFIVRAPCDRSERHRGERVNAIATMADILPTIAGEAGAATPAGADGEDLFAVADGRTPGRSHLLGGQGFSNNGRPANWVGITDGRWKYIWYYNGDGEQLFDTEHEPGDSVDRGDDPACAKIRATLRAELEQRLAAIHGPDDERFLKDGRLWEKPHPRRSDRELAHAGFPGFMRDDHPSDAKH